MLLNGLLAIPKHSIRRVDQFENCLAARGTRVCCVREYGTLLERCGYQHGLEAVKDGFQQIGQDLVRMIQLRGGKILCRAGVLSTD